MRNVKGLPSPCCKGQIRADIAQSADIEIKGEGKIEWVDNFSEPEVIRESAFCAECGKDVDINEL